MVESLDSVGGAAGNIIYLEATKKIQAEVSTGTSLTVSMQNADLFPNMVLQMVSIGEESGALPTVLQHLADYLDARQALKQKTGLALLYPILVSVVAISIVTGLLVFVVPQIVQVFQQSRQSLPLLTRVLIVVSESLRAVWPYLALGGVGALVAARMALRRDGPRRGSRRPPRR